MGCAIAVWFLGIAARSPQLHAAMHVHADHADGCSHGDHPTTPDHACAVTLFQQGVDNAVSTVELPPRTVVRAADAATPSESVPRPAADRRLHFGQAPPAR